jgi:hypothetical protein
MALVFAALLAAIVLAIVSPSDGGSSGLTGTAPSPSPSPVSTTLDTRVPTAQPQIVDPRDDDVEAEWMIDVEVKLPDEALPRRTLELVILRDGEVVQSLRRPETGTTVTVTDVPLPHPGQHTLTAALQGPGGLGPPSAPVTVTQDVDAPVLRITSPEDGLRTYDTIVIVRGTSEPGVRLTVANEASGRGEEVSVSPAGTFETRVQLEPGRNRITVTSEDAAGLKRRERVVVVAEDGSPHLEVKVDPKSVAASELPRRIKVSVRATDPEGQPLEDASVWFSVEGAGWEASDFEAQTNAEGRASWAVELTRAGPGGGDSDPTLSVEVVTADDQRAEENRVISVG